jgi:organic radical activating enzyme
MAAGYLSEIFLSFQGEGVEAGRRQLFVRLAGCHLRCRYCDTPDALERVPAYHVFGEDGTARQLPNPATVEAVLAEILPLLERETAVDGMSVTGGEPLLQADFIAELLADARLPRPRLLETSGTMPESLRTVLPQVDVVSMDIKLPSNSGERGFWDQHARFLAVAGEKAYVKILVDAGTDVAEVARAAELVGDGAAIFLQPITGSNGRVDVDADHLRRFFAAARQHASDVRVLPQTHKMLAIQ